jgi:glucoamylase
MVAAPTGRRDPATPTSARLPGAVIGDGRLLASLSPAGECYCAVWPRIDSVNQLASFRLAARVGGTLSWLDDKRRVSQRYAGPGLVVRTESAGAVVEDVCASTASALLRRVRADNTDSILVYLHPRPAGRRRGGTAYWDSAAQALVCGRDETWLALGAVGEVRAFQVGRADQASAVWRRLGDLESTLTGETVDHGDVDGAIEIAGPTATVVLAFGCSPHAALSACADARAEGYAGAAAARRTEAALRRAALRLPGDADPELAAALGQSIDVMTAVTCAETGSVIAAPEFDWDYDESGGYGYVWGRDVAWCAAGLLAAGRSDDARRALLALLPAQQPEGIWLQRHTVTGGLAPSWGLHQIDETGAILWAFGQYADATGDEDFVAAVSEATRRAADFLVGFCDPRTGLPLPSVDLWEERVGQHAYSVASVVGGLRAAADLLPDAAGATGWRAAAEAYAAAAVTHLWSSRLGRFVRSVNVAVDSASSPETVAGSVPGWSYEDPLPAYPNRKATGLLAEDPVIDVSLLGLAVPFGLIDPKDPRMVATAEAIERQLTSGEVGGVRRYAGDGYAGGNPWILTTLWLAQYHLAAGAPERAEPLVRWALDHRTETGLLPEQVDWRTGSTAWVVPLMWSHAMLLLALCPTGRTP